MPSRSPELKPKTRIAGIVTDLCDLIREGESQKIIVVCKHPQTFAMAAVTEWKREIAAVRSFLARERSAADRMLLESDIAIMESVTFAAAPPVNGEADVILAAPDLLEHELAKCDILIVTTELREGVMPKLSQFIRGDGQIVMYG